MLKNKSIAVVVPAHNEELLIQKVINTMPDFVDRIIIVDDNSSDSTVHKVKELENDKIILIEHQKNQGVGGAIITGYKKGLELDLDVIAVMGGDAQMDPDELIDIVTPVVEDKVDYVKGNRLFTGEAWKLMPRYRYLGNIALSLMTKIASGYWKIADFQCGYTAISNKILKYINLDKVYKKYGFPNDLLIHLNISNGRVCDVVIKPIYNVGEKSGIKVKKVIFTVSYLLVKGFIRRMIDKYIIRDFHPLIFFYFFGFSLLLLGFLFGILILIFNFGIIREYLGFTYYLLPQGFIVLTSQIIITGMQSLFFAMWFDKDDNAELQK